MPNLNADVQRIANQDPEFKLWLDEHHQCEDRLNELTAKSQITLDEELEEKTLKKRKLHLKDRMAERIRSWESSNVA